MDFGFVLAFNVFKYFGFLCEGRKSFFRGILKGFFGLEEGVVLVGDGVFG